MILLDFAFWHTVAGLPLHVCAFAAVVLPLPTLLIRYHTYLPLPLVTFPTRSVVPLHLVYRALRATLHWVYTATTTYVWLRADLPTGLHATALCHHAVAVPLPTHLRLPLRVVTATFSSRLDLVYLRYCLPPRAARTSLTLPCVLQLRLTLFIVPFVIQFICCCYDFLLPLRLPLDWLHVPDVDSQQLLFSLDYPADTHVLPAFTVLPFSFAVGCCVWVFRCCLRFYLPILPFTVHVRY